MAQNRAVNFSLRSFNDAARRAYLTGLRDGRAPLTAVGIWGFVTGIAMVKSGLTESMAALMTLLVYAGSAQLAALPLLEANAPLWLIFAAGMVVNVRFIIFGAALHPFFERYSTWQRMVLGFLIIDVAFVLFVSRYADARRVGTAQQLWYYLGITTTGWVIWNSTSMVGIYLGGLVPAGWGLEYAAVLALMTIVVPLVKSRPMVCCLVVSGVVAWAGQALPLRLGLVAAVLAGVLAGMMAERALPRPGRSRTAPDD
ncbi:MAG TPA: AzlC family ABC transporter permease [Burkholderiaceae bacterium]|nr:AzlC family ABC transporter permease [Burkholderiaceae bacterium]